VQQPCVVRAGWGCRLAVTAIPDLATAFRDPVPNGTLLNTGVVVYRDSRLSFDALQQRMSHGAHQAARLARAEQASLVVFDVMLDAGAVVRSPGWEQRRDRLDLIGTDWRPPLQRSPPTPPTVPSR
jgi:ATP-dependent DNA ligase